MSHTEEARPLNNRRILLGVTGSIAAYKSAELVRQLTQAGAHVQPVMTEAAQAFITPLTMQALSGMTVATELINSAGEAKSMAHIELARWAEFVLIAPASADFIARLANGRADDLLATICLATEAPIAVAPTMNRLMWEKPATQRNIAQLTQDAVQIFGPATGAQACGETGDGRMLEPAMLCQRLTQSLLPNNSLLVGRSVLITAGPTQEPIDPVRFISNRSSGKQGFALAEACVRAGAKVRLIAGPVQLNTPADVERIDVVTAEQMHQAALQYAPQVDLFIGVAAVADYRMACVAPEKIKKADGAPPVLTLEKNPDIITAVAALPDGPYVVGFAAETSNAEQHARAKLNNKRLDMIILNNVAKQGIGFDSDHNEVTVITKKEQIHLPKTSKQALSEQLIARIASGLKCSLKS